MINLADKNNCTGCSACVDACAHSAISLIRDEEGFAYPSINTTSCIECNICIDACPVLNELPRSIFTPHVYAAYAKDNIIRSESTSGGVFSLLAHAIYKKNGYVGGAVYNSDFSLSQIVDNIDRLNELRRSKYIQSDSLGIYREIENLLRKNQRVLYCACPCQIAALKSFLGKEFENLETVDFLCRGIASPLLFRRYLYELEQKYGNKVVSVKMKSKEFGWHRFAMNIQFSNGETYCKDRFEDNYFKGYLQTDLYLRPSCFTCKFKELPHISDITLGDFWKVELLDKSMDQDKGTSLVIVNSKKGQLLFNDIRDLVESREFSLEDILSANPAILKNIPNINYDIRYSFYQDAKILPFSELIKKYTTQNKKSMPSFTSIIKKIIPPSIKKLIHFSYWKLNNKLFKEYYTYDVSFNASWGGKETLSNEELRSKRMKIIRCYRKCQAAQGTLWFRYWYKRLMKINNETGVGLVDNLGIGKGLIIGHTGRIVLNSRADFSQGHLFLTHGVTVGRDVRGKRKGVPSFGKNVVIRCNSTVTGNITIGDDVLIAPNTFVNFDVPSHSVVIGNPATIHHKENATLGHLGNINL